MMKKERIFFWTVIAAEIVAAVLPLVVFSGLYSFAITAVVALELLAATAVLFHAESYENQLELLLLPFIVSPIVTSLWNSWAAATVVPVIAAVTVLTVTVVRSVFIKAEKSDAESEDKTELYADRSVLLIVPHQDDDINLMGGIIEEYIRYNSDIKICFYTNGDFENDAQVRLSESLRVADYYGIPQENIIFMGYGDRWNDEDGHIYTAPNGKVIPSASGNTKTYALPDHPAFNEGAEYRRENVVEDMKNIIETYRPTDIFCVDYDCHKDHIACSLFFEEALVEILKGNENYRPNVYKGFAYETAFFSCRDFFGLNISSTVNERRTAYMKKWVNFNHHDRIRFPVAKKAATRFIENSSVYKSLSFYASQQATDYADSIINGDKIFWHRRTDSVLYDAKISASSGDAAVLNDFKLFDTEHIPDFPMSVIKGVCVPDFDIMPRKGIWLPNGEDGEKTAFVELAKPTDIKEIYLYDSPSRSDNIVNAEIRFDNGTTVETGPLNPDGSATVISTEQKGVSSFTVKITDWDGENPGLTEIEAFETAGEGLPEFIKLTDDIENFIYDYVIEKGDRAKLSVYFCGISEQDRASISVSCDNEKCTAELSGDVIEVYCPLGESCNVTVKTENGLSDRARISNPKNKKLLKNAITFDKYYYKVLRVHIQKKYYKQMALYFYDRLMWSLKRR